MRLNFAGVHRRGWRPVLAVVLASLSMAPTWLGSVTASAADTEGLSMLQRWAPYPPGTKITRLTTTASAIATDVSGRVMYLVTEADTSDLQVRAFDLDTLRPLGAALHVKKAAPSVPVPLSWAVDEQHHVLLLAPAPDSRGLSAPVIDVVGMRSGSPVLLSTVKTGLPSATYIAGLSADPRHGRVWAIAQTVANGGNVLGQAPVGFVLDTWPTRSLAHGSTAGGMASPFRVGPTCGSPLTSTFPAAVVVARDGRSVYFGCSTGRTIASGGQSNVGDFTGVAGLPLRSDGTPDPGADLSLFATPAPNELKIDSFGWAAGSRLTLAFDSPGLTTMVVFDANHRRYVGNVASPGAKAIVGLAVSPRTGRVFYASDSGGQTKAGLGYFEASALPVTQGQFYPQFDDVIGPGRQAAVMAFDPVTRRLFVPVAEFPHDWSGLAFLQVLRSHLTPFSAPRPSDPDAGAFHGVDRAGVSDSNRAASAGAYGAEYRLVGGTSSLATNVSHFQSLQGSAHPGTRVLDVALAGGLTLSNDSATARAATVSIDDVTNGEINPSGDAGLKRIPAQACNSFGARSTTQADSISLSCDVDGARTTSDVSFSPPRVLLSDPQSGHPVTAPSPVQVRNAHVHSLQYRDGARGPLLGKVTAEADGVNILGRIQIGHITATAITSAHGQRSGSAASYKRTISHVVIDGRQICASDCSAHDVVDRINRALAGHGSIDLPDPRPSTSPGGVLAQVMQDRYAHTEQTLFNDVPADSWVAPALSVTINLDSVQPSRLIVNLAAVTSSSFYRLYRLGQSQPGTPETETPELPTVKVGGAPPPPDLGTTPTSSPIGQPADVASAPNTSTSAYVADVAKRLAFALRSPRGIFSVACIWALLALPAYLSARRRLLLEAPALVANTSASTTTLGGPSS